MAKHNSKKSSGASLEELDRILERKEIDFHGAIIKSGRYSRYEQDPYNEYQNFLYNRALFGLSVYPKEEIDAMHYDKRKRIIKVHKRAQTLINLWKQEIIITLSNHFFSTIFPDSPITKELVEVFSETDELHTNKMSFKSLRIDKAQVIERFIEEGILPRNFNELIPKKELKDNSKKKPAIPTV
jgi:hypothetical protein